jgi:hypothetical protein
MYIIHPTKLYLAQILLFEMQVLERNGSNPPLPFRWWMKKFLTPLLLLVCISTTCDHLYLSHSPQPNLKKAPPLYLKDSILFFLSGRLKRGELFFKKERLKFTLITFSHFCLVWFRVGRRGCWAEKKSRFILCRLGGFEVIGGKREQYDIRRVVHTASLSISSSSCVCAPFLYFQLNLHDVCVRCIKCAQLGSYPFPPRFSMPLSIF